MSEIASFIIYNILVILFGSITYFIMKEAVRVSDGKLSKVGFIISSTVLGAEIMLVFLLGGLYYDIPSDIANKDLKVWLNPFLIYLIIFSLAIDKRLFFPLVLFLIFGDLIANKGDIFYGINTKSFSTNLVFEIILYSFLAMMVLFPIKGRKKINNFLSTWIIFVLFIVMEIVFQNIENSLVQDKESFSKLIQVYLVKASYLILILVLQQIIIYFIERIYKNFSQLETFSIKDDISYYKMSLATKELRKIIYNEKIETGALLLLEIKTKDKEKISKILEYIKEKSSELYKDSFYFKATSNYYGIFLPLNNLNNLQIILDGNRKVNRVPEDPLGDFDNVIFQAEEEYDIKMNIGGSLYGIQSYDIDELMEFSKFLFSPTVMDRNKSRIIVYDFKRIKDRLKERISVSNLPINISKLDISFLKGISSEEIFYPSLVFEENLISSENKKATISELIKGKISVDEKNFILRHSAYQTLRHFDKLDSSIVIFYSADYLGSDDFKIINFIQKINRYNKNENVIIGLFLSKNSNKQLIKNIKELRNKGFRFALINPSWSTQAHLNEYKPDYLIELSDKKLLDMEPKKLNLKTNAISLNFNLV